MAKILGNFHLALLIGIVLLVAVMFGLHREAIGMAGYWAQWLRFVARLRGHPVDRPALLFQLRADPDHAQVPAELKPAVSKYIAPAALFWFRWAALATVVLGLLVAEMSMGGYVQRALTLTEGYRTIGIGMWLGLIMAANVWFIIWPNQKKALGIVQVDDAVKAQCREHRDDGVADQPDPVDPDALLHGRADAHRRLRPPLSAKVGSMNRSSCPRHDCGLRGNPHLFICDRKRTRGSGQFDTSYSALEHTCATSDVE